MATTLASTDIFFGGEGSGVRQVSVSPVVLFNVLDHYIRRNEGRSRVIGTLLGRHTSDGGVEIRTSFPLPHSESGDDDVAVDTDYHASMVELFRKVNANEELVGWYATGDDTDMNSVIIHEFYGRECPKPVHLLVDAGLQSSRFNVSAFLSTAYKIQNRALSSEFRSVPVKIMPDKADKVGLDVLFKNKRRQEASLATNTSLVSSTTSSPVMPSEIDNLEKSLERLLELLELVGKNVDAVVAGEIEGDITAGRYLADTLTMVPKMNSADFERLFGDNMRDLLMVSYLCKLTESQLIIGEKLLSIDIGTK